MNQSQSLSDNLTKYFYEGSKQMKRFLLLLAGAVLGAALLTCVAFAQGTIVPGDNLVVEGIPAIPASLADDVGRYTEFRAAAISSWHPTRREMLIGTRFSETIQVHELKMPGGARKQLTFSPERSVGGSYRPRTGAYFVFTRDVGGNEFYQYYRYNPSDGTTTLLTDGKSRNTGWRWSNSGDQAIYGSTRRNKQDNDLYIINPEDPKSDRLLMQLEGGGWGVSNWSPDDKKFLLSEFISANESYLWLVDVATATKTLITPKGGAEKVAYGGGTFSNDGLGIYVATDKDSEFARLTYIDLATKAHTVLTDHIKWDVDSIDLSPDGRTLAFVTNEEGVGRLHLMDTRTRKERPVPKLPVGIVSGIRWHDNNKDLGFNITSARSPADVYSLDVTTGKLDRWTESETGGLKTQQFAEAELVRWKSFDGRSISGFLYLPPVRFTGPRPVIINIHGGPEGQARPGFLGRNNYFLNELGVAMLYPNVRGSSGFGKTFLQLDNGFKREDSVKDIGALLDWIATQPDLDKDRIMVTGGSYGGYMTLAVATNYNDRIRASLDVVGISNFNTFLKNTETYRRDLRRVEYGDERDSRMYEHLEKISPLTNAHKITKPLFVVQGKNDPRVPYTEAEQIVAAARKNNTPVWFLMANDEGHGFSKKNNSDYLYYSTILFIKEHLLN